MKFLATYADSAFTGIGILEIAYDVNDRVKVVAFHGDTYSRPTWHKLKENSKGDLYFVKYRRRYYLKDMMRS